MNYKNNELFIEKTYGILRSKNGGIEMKIISFFTNNIQLITGGLIGIIASITAFRKDILGVRYNIIRGQYKAFKKIKDEYLQDRINGYFAFQNYMNRRIEPELIDYIMISSDAYSIFTKLKAAENKYTFDGKSFHTQIKRINYVLPLLGYFISSFLILFYIVMNAEIITSINIRNYIYFLLIIVGIFGPILINSIQSLCILNSAAYLEKLTQPKVTKKQKNRKWNMLKGRKNVK